MGSRFIEIDGGALHVRTDGPPERPALVFANSLGTDLRIWDTVVDGLADSWFCVRMDKRGHGLSALGDAPVTIDRLATDVLGVLDDFAIGSAAMVGVSIGGLIAQATYHLRPERFLALMLCDTADRIGSVEMWDQRIEALTASGLEAMADEILARWFAPVFHAERPVDLAGYRSMLTRTPMAGYLAACRALRDTDLSARTATIQVPTLVVCGAEDGATPPDLVSAFAARIPNARYEELASVAHLPSIEAPQKTLSLLEGLLKEAGHG